MNRHIKNKTSYTVDEDIEEKQPGIRQS